MVIGPDKKAGAIASHCNFHENQEGDLRSHAALTPDAVYPVGQY
jgi:hypothetical protein